MKKVEVVMDNLMSYLYSTTHTLLECVISEDYEIAAALRDEIDFYISNTCRYLIFHNLTNSSFDDVYGSLMEMKSQIMEEVSEMLDLPKEKRILV